LDFTGIVFPIFGAISFFDPGAWLQFPKGGKTAKEPRQTAANGCGVSSRTTGPGRADTPGFAVDLTSGDRDNAKPFQNANLLNPPA